MLVMHTAQSLDRYSRARILPPYEVWNARAERRSNLWELASQTDDTTMWSEMSKFLEVRNFEIGPL